MQQLLLPKGWKWARLGEVCEVVSGFGFPLKHQGNFNQEIPFYKVSDMNLAGNEKEMINHNNSLSREEVVTLKYRVYPSNTIIFPKIGAAIATNKKRLLTKPSIFDNNVMGLISSDNVSFSFLYYWMQSFNISSWASQSQPPSIRKSTVENYKIPLPPLPIQHKIVEILEEADNLRRFRQQADEKMKDLIPSLFVQMFGDPATNPKGWEKKKLKDVTISIKNGLFKRPNEFGSGVPLINVVDLFAEYKVDLTKLKRVLSTEKEIKKYLVEEGDLFFCRSSLKKEGVAKCAVALDLNEPTVFECHTILVRLKKKALNPLFASIYLNHPGVRTYTVNTSQTATMTTVGQKDILRQKFFLPPLPLQQEFVRLIEDIEAEKARQVESRKNLDELFNSLIQRAFTGELVA